MRPPEPLMTNPRAIYIELLAKGTRRGWVSDKEVCEYVDHDLVALEDETLAMFTLKQLGIEIRNLTGRMNINGISNVPLSPHHNGGSMAGSGDKRRKILKALDKAGFVHRRKGRKHQIYFHPITKEQISIPYGYNFDERMLLASIKKKSIRPQQEVTMSQEQQPTDPGVWQSSANLAKLTGSTQKKLSGCADLSNRTTRGFQVFSKALKPGEHLDYPGVSSRSSKVWRAVNVSAPGYVPPAEVADKLIEGLGLSEKKQQAEGWLTFSDLLTTYDLSKSAVSAAAKSGKLTKGYQVTRRPEQHGDEGKRWKAVFVGKVTVPVIKPKPAVDEAFALEIMEENERLKKLLSERDTYITKVDGEVEALVTLRESLRKDVNAARAEYKPLFDKLQAIAAKLPAAFNEYALLEDGVGALVDAYSTAAERTTISPFMAADYASTEHRLMAQLQLADPVREAAIDLVLKAVSNGTPSLVSLAQALLGRGEE